MTTGDETTMGGQHPAPAQPPRLRAVPPGTVPPLSAAPEPGTSAALVPPASAAPLTIADRAGTTTRRMVNGAKGIARELWTGPDRLVHSVVHGEAETMKEHWVLVKSLYWVPKGLTGALRTAITWTGILHHVLVAYPVKALAKALEFAAAKLDHAADRAITLYGLIAFVVLFIVLLIHL